MASLTKVIERGFGDYRTPDRFVNWLIGRHPFNETLEDYYGPKKEESLEELTSVLMNEFQIPEDNLDFLLKKHRSEVFTTKKEIMTYLEWDLENFRAFGQRKTGGYAYLHQMEIATIVAFYIQRFGIQLSADNKKIILYSCLSHDSLEEKFFEGRPYENGKFRSKLIKLAGEDIGEKVYEIIWSLTRRTNNGSDLNYRQSAEKIIRSDSKIRDFAVATKLADRIQNVKTLKEVRLEMPEKDMEWNLKNIFKSVVLAYNVREDYKNKTNSRFKPMILSMVDDILVSSLVELEKLQAIYKHRAINVAGSEKGNISVNIPMRLHKPNLRLDMVDDQLVRSLGFPDHYNFLFSGVKREIGDYFRLVDQMMLSWYFRNIKKPATPFEVDAKFIYDLTKAKTRKQNEKKVDSPFKYFDDYFDNILNENYSSVMQKEREELTPAKFYEGLLKNWGRFHYIASLMKYETSRDKKPYYPVGLVELGMMDIPPGTEKASPYLKKALGDDASGMLNPQGAEIVKNLFGYALCNHLIIKIADSN